MDENTIAIVASNLTVAYFSGLAQSPAGPAASSLSALMRGGLTDEVLEKYEEFRTKLRDQSKPQAETDHGVI